MQKALANLPVFDAPGFRAQTTHWKQYDAGPGSDRIVVEWSVGRGPSVFVYPAAYRSAGFALVAPERSPISDERWADYLELTYVPEVIAAIGAAGFRPQAICVDLRPIQIQRARRRAAQKRAADKTGHTSSGH